MIKKYLYKYFPFFTVPVGIISILPYTTLPIDNTFFWWLVKGMILYFMFLAKREFYDKSQGYIMLFISMYLVWNLGAFFHGFFMAEIYWDWKALISHTMSILVPLFAFTASNIKVTQIVLNRYIRFVLPFFPLFIPVIFIGTYGEYLAPLTLLLFFLPTLPSRYRLLVLFFTLVVITSSLDSRSDILKFSIPILLLGYYFFKSVPLKLAFELPRLILMLAPFLLLLLAISGVFNPFAMNEYAEGLTANTDEEVAKELTTDTRTALYVEVIASAVNHNYWLMGRSPARGNDSEIFGDVMERITGRRERYGNEASILNIFTWTGVIGVLLYFFIFWRASYLGIHKSNNVYVKMIGVYVAFRWLYAWVEDFNVFNLNYFMLWMMIGLCMSKSFRSLSNMEVKLWARGIFDKRYRMLDVD